MAAVDAAIVLATAIVAALLLRQQPNTSSA
jgi:hypothetical protein